MGGLMMMACGQNRENRILVLHAGSLSVPFKQMASRFMETYPGVKVVLEAHGSRTAARQISDLKRPADVMASADSQVIRDLLMPEYADFCIDFTANEMVVMFTDASKYSREIDSSNWMDILLREGVQYGHSNPDADPCGYRALLTWKLAEIHYQIPGLFEKLESRMPRKNIRPKETDLIALLEVAELDYIFIYRSIARQHRMRYVILPDEINLKSPDLAPLYGRVSVKISGKKPGEWVVQKGTPMVYGITLPKNSRNPLWGARFIAFVLGEQGRKIMEENGQPEMIPPRVDHAAPLPGALTKYFKK
jgi:molybdate/tungstate transport system substrate-binding protein